MSGEIVYLNGDYLPAAEAKVSVFDRGFLFGDSVYEVIPFYRGVGFRLPQHLARLERSLRALDIRVQQDWTAVLNGLVQRNGGGNLSAYLQVTRGSSGRRSAACDLHMEPTLFACCNPIRDIYAAGPEAIPEFRVILTEDLRWHRCDIKATNLLPNILVLQQARAAGADEALMVRDGVLTEGGSSNLFVVKCGVLYTPRLASGILGGTTRELVLELAETAGIPWREADLTRADLFAADEVWISSSTRAVVPVVAVDDRPVGGGTRGPLWRQMFELMSRFHRALMNGETE